MKRFIPLFLLVLFTITGCVHHYVDYYDPDNLVCINIVDQDGLSETIGNQERLSQYEDVDWLANHPYQKVMRIYGRDQKGNMGAYITSYHENGQVKQYLEVMNGRASGAYREWYENGQLKVETAIVGGEADITIPAEKTWLFNGCNRAWDDEGRLVAEVQYSKGDLEGISTYFHNNGNVWKKVPFHKNEIHGVSEIYLQDGTLLQATQYCNGKRHGQAYRYWNGQKIAADEMFDSDLLVWGRYYDQCGKIVSQVSEGTGYRVLFGRNRVGELHEYHNGVQDGEVKIYDENGTLASIHHIKNGIKHGEEVEYYPLRHGETHLIPMLSVNWYEGKVQGSSKTWYRSGVQESQREMSNNKKNGISTAWYKDGSIMMIEEYEHNKLVKGEYYQRNEKSPISRLENGEGTAMLYDGEGNFLNKVIYYSGKPMLDG